MRRLFFRDRRDANDSGLEDSEDKHIACCKLITSCRPERGKRGRIAVREARRCAATTKSAQYYQALLEGKMRKSRQNNGDLK